MTIHNPSGASGELTRQAQAARDLLAAYKGIVGEDEDVAMDLVEGQTDFMEIVNAMAAQEGQDKAHALAIEQYIEKLMERRDRIEKRIAKRRNALTVAFLDAGIRNLKCPVATVSLRALAASVVTTDESLIPDEFWKPRDPTLDKRGLAAALKEGRTIPGAELSNGGVAISIRMS